jgi:hypothetical protein
MLVITVDKTLTYYLLLSVLARYAFSASGELGFVVHIPQASGAMKSLCGPGLLEISDEKMAITPIATI